MKIKQELVLGHAKYDTYDSSRFASAMSNFPQFLVKKFG